MLEKIYEIATKSKEMPVIEDFLSMNLVATGYERVNEGYYTLEEHMYELSSTLTLTTHTSFDLLGKNKAGGHKITLKNKINDQEVCMFSHEIVMIDGEYTENVVKVCTENELLPFIREYRKSNTYNESTFHSLARKNEKTLYHYWKNLPKEEREKESNINLLFESLYEEAKNKSANTPISIGEMFYKSILRYDIIPFMGMRRFLCTQKILSFIVEKDANDNFIKKYESDIALGFEAHHNTTNLKEMIKIYFIALNRERKLSSRIKHQEMVIEENKEKIKKELENIEVLTCELAKLKSKTKFQKLLSMFSTKHEDQLYELRRDIEVSKYDIRNIKQENEYLEHSLILAKRNLQKITYVLNEEKYRTLATRFMEEIDNGEYDIDDYVNGNIPESVYDLFFERLTRYVA